MKNSRKLLLSLSENMYQLVKIRAHYDGQTMNAVIREAIKQAVAPVRKEETK